MRPASLLWILLVASAVVGCTTADHHDPGLSSDDLVARLTALGVTVTPQGTQVDLDYVPDPEASMYELTFTQPVDHDDPSAGTFIQHAVLIHRNTAAETPMVIYTTGYDNFIRANQVELTRLLSANQITIEHRYYGDSLPADDVVGHPPYEFSQLSIKQMADDEHAIIAILHQVYDGTFITAGKSKGGMTATYHRRFYPDDVYATVAYVAPLSQGLADPRYPAFLATVGPSGCRAAVRALSIAMLTDRRAGLEAAYADGEQDPAVLAAFAVQVESGVRLLEWSFWQYHGVAACGKVPALDASDGALLDFLLAVSGAGPGSLADILNNQAYTYQNDSQLGGPAATDGYLAPYLQYANVPDENLDGFVAPAFDPTVMPDIQHFVAHDAERILFVYGGWDPWTAGAYEVSSGRDVDKFVVPGGTHESRLIDLIPEDRTRVLDALATWTGVTPVPARVRGLGGDDRPASDYSIPLSRGIRRAPTRRPTL
jgi:hypothetical protein